MMWPVVLLGAYIIQITTSADLPPDLINLIVDRHNQLRAKLGVNSRVSWSPTLALYSRTRAELQRCRSLSHAGLTTGYGENLAMGFGQVTANSLNSLINMWVAENIGGGHHDQMAWAGSTSIGCAASNCDSKLYLSCNYLPPGNMPSQTIWSGNPPFPQNMPKLPLNLFKGPDSPPPAAPVSPPPPPPAKPDPPPPAKPDPPPPAQSSSAPETPAPDAIPPPVNNSTLPTSTADPEISPSVSSSNMTASPLPSTTEPPTHPDATNFPYRSIDGFALPTSLPADANRTVNGVHQDSNSDSPYQSRGSKLAPGLNFGLGFSNLVSCAAIPTIMLAFAVYIL